MHNDSDRCFTQIGYSSETSMGFSIFPIYEVKLDCMRDCLKEFEKRFTYWFERTKTLSYYLKIPNKTFCIVIMTRKISEVQPSMWEVNSDEFEEDSQEEEEPVINTKQTFKDNACLICLTNPPSVLFCNCGHLCLCIECEEVKSLKVCPVCKTENTIKRNIKY